jgi:hypothetical protein
MRLLVLMRVNMERRPIIFIYRKEDEDEKDRGDNKAV